MSISLESQRDPVSVPGRAVTVWSSAFRRSRSIGIIDVFEITYDFGKRDDLDNLERTLSLRLIDT